MWAINALHRGRPIARALLSAWPLLDVAVMSGIGADSTLRIALALHLIMAAMLWLPGPTRQDFAITAPRPTMA